MNYWLIWPLMAKKILVGTLLLIAFSNCLAINFSRVNISWQYDPLAVLFMDHRNIQDDKIITTFLKVRSDSLSSWSFEFWVQEGYESEEHRLFDGIVIDTLKSGSKEVFLRVRFNKPEENLMVVKVFKEEEFYYYDIPLINGSIPFPPVYPIDADGLPILENYLKTEQFTWKGSSNFYAIGYEEMFERADPPMADMKPLAPSIMQDTSFAFSNPVTFQNNFFYVVMKDSTSASGVTVLKQNPYFPEFKILGELVSSMGYILNGPERKALGSSKNLKSSFDSFWLKTYATKFRARNAIRNYFNWVEQSNRFFTDFKEGWKTDRGMLFIVFGVPDEVYRSENYEEWYYDSGPAFVFSIISTFFSPKTYALRRRPELESLWLEYIAAIRRGSNE